MEDMPLTSAMQMFLQNYQMAQQNKRQKDQDALNAPSVPSQYDPNFKISQAQRYKELEAANDWRKQLALAKLAKGQGVGQEMTPGRKAADQAFGKEYQDWSTGGAAQTQKSLEALQGAEEELKNTPGVSGPLRGALPDWARAFTNPEAVGIKERIRGAVQNTLKATLGAQFTEKEGERIFNQAYNDRLPVEENVKRLDATIKQLQSMAQAKSSASEHFENRGTLTGWQGRLPAGGGMPQGQQQNPKMQAAQQALNDPEATPEEKAMAKRILGIP